MASETEALDPQTQLHLKKCRESLYYDFGKLHTHERIDELLDDSVAQVRARAGFDDFVPAIAEKLARDRLRAAARTEGTLGKDVPDVLFLAVHDTGRGQMGAAIMQSLGEGRVHAHSAGTGDDSSAIEPAVTDALREIGIDLDEAYSKPLTAEILADADVIVTMGRSTGDVEIPEGARHLDWRIGDPSGGAPLDEVRHIRDDIHARVTRLLDELVPPEGR